MANLQNATISEIQNFAVQKTGEAVSNDEYTKQFLRHVDKIRMIHTKFTDLNSQNATMVKHLDHIQKLLNVTRNLEIDKKEISVYKTLGIIYSAKKSEIQGVNILQNYLQELSAVALEGYKEILSFKQFLTGQELRYAIKDKNMIYEISEEKYLELWGANITTWNGILYKTEKDGKTKKLNFNFIHDAKIILNNANNALHTETGLNIEGDPLYEYIEMTYGTKNSKGNINNKGRLWELYTQTKYTILNLNTTQRISQEYFDSKEKDVEDFTKKYVESVYFSDTTAFYKIGDTAQKINEVRQMMENKEITDNANISINTIKNGIKYLNTTFRTGRRRNEIVKRLVNSLLDKEYTDELGILIYGTATQEAQKKIQEGISRLVGYDSKNGGAKVQFTNKTNTNAIKFYD